MPPEPSDSSRQESFDDSLTNIQESIEQTSGPPTNSDIRESSPTIINDDDGIDTTELQLVHHPARMREIIDVDAYDTDVEELNVGAPQTRVKREGSPSIKIEIFDDDFDWTSMGGQHIDLTEANQEMTNPLPTPQVSILTADLGNSVLGRRNNTAPLSRDAMLEASRMMAQRSLGRSIATGASSIFGGGTVPITQPVNSFDTNADAASRFQQMREAYLRKKLLGELTNEDEIRWGKVKAAEKKRITHIQEGECSSRGIDNSSDEAAESNDDLFLPQGSSSRKRRHAEIIDDSEDDMDRPQPNGTSAPRDVVDILGSEGEAYQRMKKKAPSKRKAANGRAREINDARMVGIEELLINENRKARKGGKSKPRKRKAKKKDAKGKSAERPRPGPLGNVLNAASIGSSNIYDEANENLNAAPAPIISSSRKDKALKQMLIDIPLENLSEARGEKKNILESSKILGKYGLCHLANDGTNNWVLKGMATTLYSYQVHGAAWMKLRETGDVAPYGGILADQMGLGKTLQILACMVANRPEPTADCKTTLIVCTASIAHQWEQEIQKHTQGVFPIIVRQRAGNRISGIAGADQLLQKADVVVAT